MKFKKELLDQFEGLDKTLVKRGGDDLVEGVKEQIKKYGALYGRDVDEYQRFSTVLSEYVPSYGSFLSYLGMLGGETSLKEFPDKKKALKGALVFLKENGFYVYEPGTIITQKPMKASK